MKSFSTFSLTNLAILIAALIMIQACGDSPSRFQVTFNPPAPFEISEADSSFTTSDGLQIYIIEEGYGPFEVIPRDQVSAYYTGRIIENGEIGRVFDSTYRNGVETPGRLRNLTPSPIQSSTGTVSPLIDGFRRAVIGMKEGEKRVAIIPPSLGYGDSREGTNGFNLRNDTLRFDIELAGIL